MGSGGWRWGRRAAGSGSDSPELSGPSWSRQPGETSRKAPGVEAARSRAAQQVRQRPRPAPLRAAPGGFSDAPQRQCLAQGVPSTPRHHCFNTKSRTLIRRELIILNDRISNPNRLSAQGKEECCTQLIEHLINKADKMSLLKALGETV